MHDDPLAQRVSDVVERRVGSVASLRPLAGGDVANAYVVNLVDGERVFAKTHVSPPPGFFSTEAAGLQWLAESSTVRVPAVLAVDDSVSVLVLEWIPVGDRPAAGRSDEAAFRSVAGRSASRRCIGVRTGGSSNDGKPSPPE